MSRRAFVVNTACVGGGMAISLVASKGVAALLVNGQSPAAGPVEINPWLTIAPDDTVMIRVASPESGNGVMTQCAMTVTEELHCDWSKVRVESISLNRDFREDLGHTNRDGISTFAGRSTTPDRMKHLLQLGASARARLKAAAAEHWNVSPGEIETRDSLLTHPASGRTLRYGEIAARAATVKLASEPAPKPPSEWTFLGKASPTKLSNVRLVDGSGVFGIDVRVPGMRYAALMQSPVHGGKLKRYDFDAIKHMPGVRGIAVVDRGVARKPLPWGVPGEISAPQSAIAVVADHYWQARTALDALPIEWDAGPGAKWKTIEQVYETAYAALQREGEKIEKDEGHARQAIAVATRHVEATYLTPFCDQAPMEPLNGTALVTEGRVELWHPAAISGLAYHIAAEEAGVTPEHVHFHQTLIGGSFGRRLFADDVCMVVAVAKQFPGTPVQVIWSREEMTRQGRYRALQAVKLTAALDQEEGMPTALHCRVAHHGSALNGLVDGFYANGPIPNVRIESTPLALHILHGAYRAPGYNSHAFFVESFIDECATAAGIDPLEYRLRLLAEWPDSGWRKCLEEVAAKSNWGKKLPKGQGQGLAISNWNMGGKPHAGTTVALVATVAVTPAGELNVENVDLAFDCGRVLNEDAVRAQLEGGVLFGLNMSLNEELTIRDGGIVEGNFDEYPMLRMAQIPKGVNVHLGGLSGHERITEVGEPPVGPAGPAVANAIYRAIGKRIRTMPFRKHDLRWA
jgi:isoquinoline 1-oxidoreductase beta subunit